MSLLRLKQQQLLLLYEKHRKLVQQKNEKIKKKYENNFKGFLLEFLPSYFNYSFCPFHDDVIHTIENLNVKTEIETFIAPRNHGKSVLLSLGAVLWLTCYMKRKFIVIISSSGASSQSILRNIVEEIEYNDKLIEVFGLKPAMDKGNRLVKWSDSDIILSNGVRIVARGFGQSLRGIRQREKRPDFILIDDLEKDEEVESEAYRKRQMNWFNRAIRFLGDLKYTNIILVGTILHWDSLLHNICRKKNPLYRIHFYKAIKEDGTPLWKERYTIEELEKIREDNLRGFQCEWMNEPYSEDERVFNSERFHLFDMEAIDIDRLYKWAYLDPALEEKKHSDYSCLITYGKDDDGTFYVLDCNLVKLRPEKLTDFVVSKGIEWQWHELGIESNGFQKYVVSEIERKFEENRFYMSIKKIKNYENKIARIKTIEPFIVNGRIKFRRDMFKAYKKLIEQLDYFPDSKLDGPDSLHGGFTMQSKGKVSFQDVKVF